MPKTLRAKALEKIQLLARLQASNASGFCRCVTCGKVDHYKNMDGGHFISKGSSSRWALVLENVHPQCKGCNSFHMRHGTAPHTYTLWMIDYYGRDFVDHMIATKKDVHKLYASDYRDMIEDFNQQILTHERRIGLRGSLRSINAAQKSPKLVSSDG